MFPIILFFIVLAIVLYLLTGNASLTSYFPTNSKDLDNVIDSLELEKQDVVIDVGAGSGTVIFAAAKRAKELGLKTQFVAIDVNFIFTLILLMRRMFHPNKQHITIHRYDIFKFNIDEFTKGKKAAYYVYISPWLNEKVGTMLQELEQKGTIVSYCFPIDNLKKDKKLDGVHPTYIYHI